MHCLRARLVQELSLLKPDLVSTEFLEVGPICPSGSPYPVGMALTPPTTTTTKERSQSLVPEPVFISKMVPKSDCDLDSRGLPGAPTHLPNCPQSYLHPLPKVVGRRGPWGAPTSPRPPQWPLSSQDWGLLSALPAPDPISIFPTSKSRWLRKS